MLSATQTIKMKLSIVILVIGYFSFAYGVGDTTTTTAKPSSKPATKSKAKMGGGIPFSLNTYFKKFPKNYIYGHCSMSSNSALEDGTPQLSGSIDFRQPVSGGPTEIQVNVKGFDTKDVYESHGIHVHEFGDLSQGCSSTGGHYNPFDAVHGSPRDSPKYRHFGDLGNIRENAEGMVKKRLQDYLVSLLGPFSVFGRAVVIHEKADDLGRGRGLESMLTGNAGRRLACCTVGISDGARW